MIKLGEWQTLILDQHHDTYAILREKKGAENGVMIPGSQLTNEDRVGTKQHVFIYRDTHDRLIATKEKPLIELGKVAALEVKETTKIGAFLDWGLDKDLFLPFSEQTFRPERGKRVVVYLYIDKSDRLCASMKMREFLTSDHRYKRNDMVCGLVYSIHEQHGAFVAVDGQYDALIDRKDIFGVLEIGEEVQARVTSVRPDGKMKLAIKQKAYKAIPADAQVIIEELKENGGFLPYNDKSDALDIRDAFCMSKASFKKAIGHLYKKRMIEFKKNGIKLK